MAALFGARRHPISVMDGSAPRVATAGAGADVIRHTKSSPATMLRPEAPSALAFRLPRTGLWGASLMIFKAMVGAGLFALPFAFRLLGFGGGIIAMAICGALIWYTNVLIVRVHDVVVRDTLKRDLTYVSLVEHTFGRVGAYIVYFLIVFTTVGGNAAYLIFCGQVMNSLIPRLSITAWAGIVAAAILPLCLVRNTSFLAWTSMAGNVGVALVVATVLAKGAMVGTIRGLPNYTAFRPGGFMAAFGIIGFLYACSTTVLTIQKAMATKPRFAFAMAATITFTFIACSAFALVNYLYFGADVCSIVVLNIGGGPLGLTAKIAIVVDLAFTYPLAMAGAREVIERSLFTEKTPWLWWKQAAVRTVFVAVTFAISFAPAFGIVVNIVGGWSVSALAFILPCIMLLQLRRFHLKAYSAQLDYLKRHGLIGAAGAARRASQDALMLPEHTSKALDHGHRIVHIDFQPTDAGAAAAAGDTTTAMDAAASAGRRASGLLSPSAASGMPPVLALATSKSSLPASAAWPPTPTAAAAARHATPSSLTVALAPFSATVVDAVGGAMVPLRPPSTVHTASHAHGHGIGHPHGHVISPAASATVATPFADLATVASPAGTPSPALSPTAATVGAHPLHAAQSMYAAPAAHSHHVSTAALVPTHAPAHAPGMSRRPSTLMFLASLVGPHRPMQFDPWTGEACVDEASFVPSILSPTNGDHIHRLHDGEGDQAHRDGGDGAGTGDLPHLAHSASGGATSAAAGAGAVGSGPADERGLLSSSPPNSATAAAAAAAGGADYAFRAGASPASVASPGSDGSFTGVAVTSPSASPSPSPSASPTPTPTPTPAAAMPPVAGVVAAGDVAAPRAAVAAGHLGAAAAAAATPADGSFAVPSHVARALERATSPQMSVSTQAALLSFSRSVGAAMHRTALPTWFPVLSTVPPVHAASPSPSPPLPVGGVSHHGVDGSGATATAAASTHDVHAHGIAGAGLSRRASWLVGTSGQLPNGRSSPGVGAGAPPPLPVSALLSPTAAGAGSHNGHHRHGGGGPGISPSPTGATPLTRSGSVPPPPAPTTGAAAPRGRSSPPQMHVAVPGGATPSPSSGPSSAARAKTPHAGSASTAAGGGEAAAPFHVDVFMHGHHIQRPRLGTDTDVLSEVPLPDALAAVAGVGAGAGAGAVVHLPPTATATVPANAHDAAAAASTTSTTASSAVHFLPMHQHAFQPFTHRLPAITDVDETALSPVATAAGAAPPPTDADRTRAETVALPAVMAPDVVAATAAAVAATGDSSPSVADAPAAAAEAPRPSPTAAAAAGEPHVQHDHTALMATVHHEHATRHLVAAAAGTIDAAVGAGAGASSDGGAATVHHQHSHHHHHDHPGHGHGASHHGHIGAPSGKFAVAPIPKRKGRHLEALQLLGVGNAAETAFLWLVTLFGLVVLVLTTVQSVQEAVQGSSEEPAICRGG